MYNLYTEKCISDQLAPFSKAFFVKFKKENKFSIFKPRKDKCDMCASYEVGQVSENKIALHIAHKDRAQAEKKLDKQLAKENRAHVFTMDMQAVKLCPYLQASVLYYSIKLKVHNLAIYNIGNAEYHNYWWYETEGNLEASVFTTILIKHLEKVCLDKKSIVVYTDGCRYQNRNVVLSNGLLKYSMKYKVSVQQKYLIKGHTQMKMNSIYSLIERSCKEKDIFLPTDYVRYTLNAKKYPNPLNAQLLTHTTFFNDYKNNLIYNSIRPGKTIGDPECKDIRGLMYDPSGIIYYKLTFDDPWAELPQRTTRNKAVFIEEALHPLYIGPLKLTKTKWNDLQKLKKVLPVDVHPFYDTLPYESAFKERKQKM